jgi:hypothetical protein
VSQYLSRFKQQLSQTVATVCRKGYVRRSNFHARLQNCEKRLLASPYLSFGSVGMEHLRSHWSDFREILYLSVFPKSVEKIQVSIQSDYNNGTLHEDQYAFFVIPR